MFVKKVDHDYLCDLVRPECEDRSQHSVTLTRLSRVERLLPVLAGHLVNILSCFSCIYVLWEQDFLASTANHASECNCVIGHITVVNAWQLPCNREMPRFAAVGHWLTPGLIREMNLIQKLHWKWLPTTHSSGHIEILALVDLSAAGPSVEVPVTGQRLDQPGRLRAQDVQQVLVRQRQRVPWEKCSFGNQ